MQPNQTSSNQERVATFAQNHQTILSVLKGPRTLHADKGEEPDLTFSLERVVVDRETNEPVPFEGDTGIEALLGAIAQDWPTFAKVEDEGHLVGLFGEVNFGDHMVGLKASLDAGGQLITTAGPSPSVADLSATINTFDRELHIAALSLGMNYQLLAEGYNPLASSPLDIPLVPQTRWTLLTAHLAQTGRYARDAMRCACSTRIAVEHNGDRSAIEAFRLATALSPVLCFLTDNVRSFRGNGARRSPRMVRSVIWDEVDPERCGVVPGTFRYGFSLDAYLSWLESRQTILFAADDGTMVSTGKNRTRALLEERHLSPTEAEGLLHTVYPCARLMEGVIELPFADSLRPRMAVGYLAFVKGLFCSGLAVDTAFSCLGNVADGDVHEAFLALRRDGWDATVYGKNAVELVDELLSIARSSLKDDYERSVIDNIAEQWEVRMVPRDTFIHQEIKESRGW